MTVCVAAICGQNILLGASDRMLTAGDVEFEPETPKIYSITNSSVLMIAGESSLQMLILSRLFQFAADRLKANPQEWLPIENLANQYLKIYQSLKSEKAETRVLAPLGLTLDTFIKRQQEMSAALVTQLTSEILNFDMPSIEAIVAGVDVQGAHIFVVNNFEVACRDAIGFAAIGVGFWHANSQFMFAEHNRSRPLPETLLLTYAAKRRAEVAPGIGEGTDMFSIGPNPGTYGPITEAVVNDVEKIYRKTRDRANRSVKRSNEEVTKYVENLGKDAAQQQQQPSTPTPQPESKPSGKETDGTGAPN